MANTQPNVKSVTGLYYNIENHENMPLTTVYLGSFSEVPVFGRVPNLQMIDDYIITARPWGLPGLATSVRASQDDDDGDDDGDDDEDEDEDDHDDDDGWLMIDDWWLMVDDWWLMIDDWWLMIDDWW